MYIPKRVFISAKCVGLPKTEEYLERIRRWSPEAEIIHYEGKFTYPHGFSPHDMFHYAKESVLINERTAPFILSFPSPGDIVEDFTTVGNLVFQCVSKCHYCYLMMTDTHEIYLYTNLDRFENELATAPYAHRAVLTLWTMVSYATKSSYMKVPFYLYRATDELRDDCVRLGVVSDEEAQEYLLQHRHARIFESLRRHWQTLEPKQPFPIKESDFEFPEVSVREWYRKNSMQPLSVNISEFTDIVAVDHLTGHLDYLLRLLPQFPDVHLDIRTKSTYFDEMLRHPGLGRVHVMINFNTPRAIARYEPGTSPLIDRIEAFKRVQRADGYLQRIVIEPIIAYDGCVEEYTNLVHQIMQSIDPTKIRGLTIGAVRYKVTEGNLMTTLKRNFPDSDILDTPEPVHKAEPLDGRARYGESFRELIYGEMIKVFRSYNNSVPIHLGTEKHTLWDRLRLDRHKYISSSVHQYTEENAKVETDHTAAAGDVGAEGDNAEKHEPKPAALEDAISQKCLVATLGVGSTNKSQPETLVDRGKVAEADRLLSSMDAPEARLGWSNIFASGIIKALLREYYSPIKIVGWIGDITAPTPIKPRNKVQAGQSDLRGCELTIVDTDRKDLKTLMYPVDAKLYELQRQNRRIVFCGAIVPINVRRGSEPRLFLWKVIPSHSAEDLIAIEDSADVSRLQEVYLREASQPGGIMQHVRNELVSHLGIKGLEEFPELRKCVDVMIYQAFSDGMTIKPKTSNRIHTLVIGPPGIGKNFLIQIARVLNPVFFQATAVGGKVSTAGLVGSVLRKSRGSISQPGYLPMSSGGVLAFQDFHQLKGNREAVLQALSEAMEDGQVTDANSPRTTHEAVTAIHLDLNRIRQVDPTREVDTYSDVRIPFNVVSRFDFIIDLPSDLATRLKPIEEAFSGESVLSSYPAVETRETWKRDLQRLIAYMRTYWREVTIPPEVNEYAFERVKEEFGLMGEQVQSLEPRMIEDNISRTSRSVHKFVKAIACADHNPTASRADVDKALEFIKEKIRFLSTFKEDAGTDTDPRVRRIRQRLDSIVDAFGSSQFTTGDVVNLHSGLEGAKEVKTVRQQVTRDLARLQGEDKIESLGHGRWRLKVQPKKPQFPKLEKAAKRRRKSSSRPRRGKAFLRKKRKDR